MSRVDLLLPALDNVPVYFVVLALLAALVVVSLLGIRQRAAAGASAGGMRKTRTVVAGCTGLLLTFWLVFAAGMLAFAGASAGSLLLTALPPLVALLTLSLTAVLLVAWARGKAWADLVLAMLVLGFCAWVLAFQRLWFCEPPAWAGVVSARTCTARLYATGSQGAIRDVQMASRWYGLAAEQGSETAVAALVEIEPSRLARERMLLAAARADNRAAMWELFRLLGHEAGLPWLRAAVERRHPEAVYTQSGLVRRGDAGLTPDSGRADALLREAAELGSSAARADLALAFEQGDRATGYSRVQSRYWERRVDPRWQGSARWRTELSRYRQLRDAAGRGEPGALLALAADFEERGRRDPYYRVEAERWLVEAARAGAADAQFELAFRRFRQPDASAEDLAAARDWLTAAADQRHRYALSNIAHFLASGQHGFDVDLARARDYARTLLEALAADPRANERERRQARQTLAAIETELAQETQWRGGLDELEASARTGDPEAQYRLFEKYGADPVRGDYGLAMQYLHAAAAQGHLEARYRSAFSVLSGPRTAEQEANAYAWMQYAADRGHRGAMVFMAQAHLRGVPKQGIEKSPAAARRLLEAALAGLEGDIVYQRVNGSATVMTTRESVERMLARIETE